MAINTPSARRALINGSHRSSKFNKLGKKLENSGIIVDEVRTNYNV